ncbi:uncharacterized protein STEHIDRAFT_170003 [Stereum hirsutum FP-91666 SS1]|uniref:uncharacterized protein n=1 Tax=Stereum hirsutum (strain FP-91666) TaxID=721885 RepID=UPI00044494E2|nr:uncharacterized protein STEHIDRAFT_170003 [Stereum hirsutum FP-91666 SS1]EIM84262.1 hypothetical protein STEHIDRAFT_170003 [Stereum hirsutum FP-91666 SS1]
MSSEGRDVAALRQTVIQRMSIEPFHSAPPLHTHRQFKTCGKFARCEGLKLSKCNGCSAYQYCSSACQKADCPRHKFECQSVSAQRKYLVSVMNNRQAWPDLMSWIEFHHASLVNSTVAAMNLPSNPTAHENHFLALSINCGDDNTLPPERRFRIESVDYVDRDASPEWYCYTMQIWHLLLKLSNWAKFGPGDATLAEVPWPKAFGCDRTVAAATPNSDWKRLLTDALENGKRMKFCCKKMPGACCCGGWTHGGQEGGASVADDYVHAEISEVD